MISSYDDLNRYVSKDEITEKTTHKSLFTVSPIISGQDNMARGSVDFIGLQDGLSVHYSNAYDVQDLEVVRECQPRLCISFFLKGDIEAYIGEDRIPMAVFDEETQVWKPVASIFSQRRPELFKRYAKRGCLLKKLIITIEPEWLDKLSDGSREHDIVKEFTMTHLARRNWTPSPKSTALVEQIIASGNIPDVLRTLYVESRVIMLIEESLRELIGDDSQILQGNLRPHDRERLTSIEKYLQNHVGHQISTKELAEEVSLTIHSLQRLLSKAYGMSASKFIRTFMLERARTMIERDGISIAEAAHIAGYNSPANFATAFKKCFGISPSSLTGI